MSGSNTALISQQAMIKKNGHIVALDGVSPLTFTGVAAGSYNIAVLHRFHLPIRTVSGVTMSASSVTNIDLTVASSAIGTKLVGGKYVMYAGDVNNNNSISTSDITLVRAQNVPTMVTTANYSTALDINLNGFVSTTDVNLVRGNNVPTIGINLNQ